jgi:hypothetical protein
VDRLRVPRNSAPSSSDNTHRGKYKPEALSHFPFVDDRGTVSDILNGRRKQAQANLMEMGIPGRRRFIAHVFQAMRLDRNGIRLSDLPEALEVRKCLSIFFPLFFTSWFLLGSLDGGNFS